MNLDWLKERTIYVTLHGSQAYGLNNELSDMDVKGICVPPKEVEYNLFERFEQAENHPLIEERLGHLRNPKNPKFESVIYSLRKFFLLASGTNPNIIELLWTDPKDHFVKEPLMEALLASRDSFLSSKAKFTFSGYAFAQAAKIERHRKWIVMGELQPPKREDFGLPPEAPRGVTEVFSYIKAKVEQWNLNQFPLEEAERADLKETIWELMDSLVKLKISWDNWPDAYSDAVVLKMQADLNLKDDVIRLINAERAYYKAKSTYDSWVRWKKERNPARRALEVACGYDSKHASHLVRLMRMGYEIMTEGKVIVKRPDAEELLDVKNGKWTFERVMAYKDEMQAKLDAVYAEQKKLHAEGKKTVIPWGVDFAAINEMYHDLYERYNNQ